MPCFCPQSDPTATIAELNDKIKDLTIKLCDACKTMTSCGLTLDDKLYGWYFRHRNEDKKNAIGMAEQELKLILDRVAQIQKLGGFPGEEIKKEIIQVKDAIKLLENSDPLLTQAY